jgi:hypothetical protein
MARKNAQLNKVIQTRAQRIYNFSFETIKKNYSFNPIESDGDAFNLKDLRINPDQETFEYIPKENEGDAIRLIEIDDLLGILFLVSSQLADKTGFNKKNPIKLIGGYFLAIGLHVLEVEIVKNYYLTLKNGFYQEKWVLKDHYSDRITTVYSIWDETVMVWNSSYEDLQTDLARFVISNATKGIFPYLEKDLQKQF